MPVEVGVVLIGAGFAVGVSLAVAVWFERWKAKQPDPEGCLLYTSPSPRD